MAEAKPVRFAAKSKRGEYWVVEVNGLFAVGLIRRNRVLVDGCERFSDDVDALCLALDRAA